MKFVPVCSILLLILLSLTFFPISHETSYTEATSGTASTLTLDVSDAALSLTPSAAGTFSSSTMEEQSTISVTTTNYTGYTLMIKSGTANTGKLVNTSDNTKYLDTISDAISATTFNTATYNNKWGYLPSKFNSANNTNYRPAPSTDGDILDHTGEANNTANDYTISLGARADLTNPAGDYSNTFIITATANPVSYAIAYKKGSDDTAITNMPSDKSAEVTDADFEGFVTLDTKEPARPTYLFQGWCTSAVTGNSTTNPSCTGTTYQPGAEFPINQTTENKIILTAIWKLNAFTVTINVDPSGYGTVSPASLTIPSGTALPSSGATDTSITIGGNTITASPASNYKLTNWTHSCGTTLTGACTITANFESAAVTFDQAFANAGKSKTSGYYKMQDMTASICSAVTGPTNTTSNIATQLIDTRDNKIYWVNKLLDGNCWMTQNLDYDIKTTGNEVAVIGGTTRTWNSAYPTDKNDGFGLWKGNNGASFEGDSRYLPNGTGSFTNITCTAASNGGENCHYHVGNYYQWLAATGGSGTSDVVDTDATASICPKGWRLPTSNSTTANYSFGKLTTAYSIPSNSDANLLKSPLWFVRAGSVSLGYVDGPGLVGRVWSSRVYLSSSAYGLGFDSSNVGPSVSGSCALGYSVRCVAE